MTFAPAYDLIDGQVSPNERLKALMLKVLTRRKGTTPAKNEGWFADNNTNAEGDGQSIPTTTAQAGTQN